MNGRLRLGLLALVTVSFTAIPLHPPTVSAQEASARFRVIVPEIQGLNGAGDKFGERLADQLRDLINDMATHQPVGERELKQALREYDIDMEDLNCTRARQLAPRINAQLVFCGSYSPEGEGFRVETMLVTSNGEEFPIDPFSVPEKGQKEAAQQIYQALQVQSDQARASQFCGDYASSGQWEDALTNCTRAIELNPNTVGPRYTRGVTYREMGRLEDALGEFQEVLELDPLHESAMQNAGYLSAQLGQDEQARDYYERYLELNPANARVRMTIAYDLAEAGDPLGAMQFIEVGLEVDPEDVELLKQHGGFAFAAGAEAAEGQEEMPPEVAELYQKALDSYEKVYEVQGAEMDVSLLMRMVRAHLNLGENQEAVEFAERVLETHGDEASVWSIYADALQRSGQVDDALAALERVRELDPDYANILARKGQWLLEAGRLDEAAVALQEAAEVGEQSADRMAELLFASGVNEGLQKDEYAHAIKAIRLAKEFDVSDLARQQFDFFLGYAIFESARVQQEPNTLETARATLPRFQEVLRLMQSCADYAQRNDREGSRQELMTATNTFIEIQEAIIARGR